MSRHEPKTFAEARAISDPIRRADALLKLSQEAEDRRRSQTTMRKVEGHVLSDDQIAALTAFLSEWEADADNFGDEQELMDTICDAIDGGVLPDNFDRVFNAAYQATVEEYNNPSPNLGYDAEGFARALTELLNTLEGGDYEPNTRESEKAARPAMRLGIAKASSDSRKADKYLGDALIGLSNADTALSGNPELSLIQGNVREARGKAAQARQDIRDYDANPGNKAAGAAMRKAAGGQTLSGFINSAQRILDWYMSQEYFRETYTEGDLASAALVLAYKRYGADSPNAKKIVRETGSRF